MVICCGKRKKNRHKCCGGRSSDRVHYVKKRFMFLFAVCFSLRRCPPRRHSNWEKNESVLGFHLLSFHHASPSSASCSSSLVNVNTLHSHELIKPHIDSPCKQSRGARGFMVLPHAQRLLGQYP